MPSDLRDIIRSAAIGPAKKLDVDFLYRRGRRRATIATALSIAGIVLVVAGAVAVATNLSPSRPRVDPAGQNNDATPGPSPADVVAPCGGFDVCTHVDTPIEQFVVGDDAVWAAGFMVFRIDPATDEVEAIRDLGAWAVELLGDESHVWAVVESDGHPNPWVQVVALDPESLEVSARSTDLPGTNTGDVHAAIGSGAVWVTGPGDAVHRVDAETLEVESFPYSDEIDRNPDHGPPHVAVVGETLWLGQDDGTLAAVDTRDGSIIGTPTELGRGISAMAARGDDLFGVLYDGEGTLVRFTRGRQVGTAPLPEGGPLEVAVRADDVFVLLETPSGTKVIGFNAVNLDVLDPVDGLDGTGGMGAGPAGVWVSDWEKGTVFRERP
jgi:hypothetical protein